MNLTPEMILRGYQANTAALEEMIFVKGKVAVVTGGTSGLGFCVARRLCQGGAKVVLASSPREKGDLAVRLLKEEGFDVIFYFFRAEGAVLTGAYAALQDWDALFQFAYSHSREKVIRSDITESHFDSATDVVKSLSQRIGLRLFLDR